MRYFFEAVPNKKNVGFFSGVRFVCAGSGFCFDYWWRYFGYLAMQKCDGVL